MFEELIGAGDREYLIKNPRTGRMIRAKIHAIIFKNDGGLMFKMMDRNKTILSGAFAECELEEIRGDE